MLAELLRLAHVDAEVQETAVALRPVDLAQAWCGADTARAVLGWAPRVAWGETLAAVLADWRCRVGIEDDGLAR